MVFSNDHREEMEKLFDDVIDKITPGIDKLSKNNNPQVCIFHNL